MSNVIYEVVPVPLPSRERRALLALRRKAPFRRPAGGHRPRVRVLAGVTGMSQSQSHWEVLAECRCGWACRQVWYTWESPGPLMWRVLRSARSARSGLGSASCQEMSRLRDTSEVMSS